MIATFTIQVSFSIQFITRILGNVENMLLMVVFMLHTNMLFNKICVMLIFAITIILLMSKFLAMSTLGLSTISIIFLGTICPFAYAAWRLLILVISRETSRIFFVSRFFSINFLSSISFILRLNFEL